MTVEAQVDKLKERFGIAGVVLVRDRGMLIWAIGPREGGQWAPCRWQAGQQLHGACSASWQV